MAIILFSASDWGRLGAVAIMQRATKATLTPTVDEVVRDLLAAADSNARAYLETRDLTIAAVPDEDALREAAADALRDYPRHPGATRAWVRLGAGVMHNCAGDPLFEEVRPALARLDAVYLNLPEGPAPEGPRFVVYEDAPRAPVPGAVEVRPSKVKPEHVEIHFRAKPSDRERVDLRAAGFRWFRQGGCWYGPRANLPAKFQGLEVREGEGSTDASR
jgi:hypothetical protein